MVDWLQSQTFNNMEACSWYGEEILGRKDREARWLLCDEAVMDRLESHTLNHVESSYSMEG